MLNLQFPLFTLVERRGRTLSALEYLAEGTLFCVSFGSSEGNQNRKGQLALHPQFPPPSSPPGWAIGNSNFYSFRYLYTGSYLFYRNTIQLQMASMTVSEIRKTVHHIRTVLGLPVKVGI